MKLWKKSTIFFIYIRRFIFPKHLVINSLALARMHAYMFLVGYYQFADVALQEM